MLATEILSLRVLIQDEQVSSNNKILYNRRSKTWKKKNTQIMKSI